MKDKRITIFGGGVSGASLARLARSLGARVFVSDTGAIRAEIKEGLDSDGIEYEEGGHTDHAFRCDEAVLSSGFPPRSEAVLRLTREGVPIKGEVDFALPRIKGRKIAVTGTNGKTTTTALIGFLLSGLGARAASEGNIGAPLADHAGLDLEFSSIELSSFQLHWAREVEFDCAVLTNIEPDHIDWHGSFDAYAADKIKIFSFVRNGGACIARAAELNFMKTSPDHLLTLAWQDTPEASGADIVLDAAGRRAYLGGSSLFDFADTKLNGSHNMENAAMAMTAVVSMGFDRAQAARVLSGFEPQPHRCALVLERDGIRYIDDSKGTNVAASRTALTSLDGRKVVILGGKGKGEDYAPLVGALRDHARHAVLIGAEREKIAAALNAGGWHDWTYADCMEEAVEQASNIAVAGDVVLLSPACTSWDMYNNYGERGDHFASIIRERYGIGR